ncbi:type VI secretion system membrane subunit TssM [Holophaga foetida]|uniref:type VI secretion system membrane subunit TssM n=1 Tax=Holophaga foetida TaxID=35839 RepID=UPI0002472A67|nr:type VI secretion system membrane subunit TssM [Holophaga foetida]
MSWLRNTKILSAIIFLVLIGLIWFAGPYMGLKSSEARFTVIILILLIWVAILMVGKVIQERSAKLLEKVLRRKADDAVVSASPEQRAEAAMLRQRLLAAIQTLKTSNLGKTRGNAALYELPWYMIVGHPSAGKSCALSHSGLKFPLAAKGSASVQGIGGTRNCDWFFSTEGVLLDTAGRYSTEAEDRAEWLEFLKLLKKHRPKAPLNGILIALSLPELLQHHSEAFIHYARQIRQRINEVDDTFGTKVPVYLVFTKIDLLRGFDQFFEDLTEEERKQVWGATLTHEQPENFNAVKAVGQHFDALFHGLTQLGTDKLASNKANQKRPALFAFPLEFHGIKDAICKFTEHLVAPDPYHTKPLIRGFYLTSALQENSQTVTTTSRISNMFDLTKFGFKPSELAGSKPFFLESLFRQVIFKDMHLVGRTVNPKQNRTKLMGLSAGVLILAIMSGCWTWSFTGNRKLISEAQEELVISKKLFRNGNLGDQLKALQVLQYRLEQLHQFRKQGHPWKIGYGLYQGDEIEKTMRAEYFAGARQVMLEPIREQLEEKLSRSLSGEAPAEGTPPPARAQRSRTGSTILTLPSSSEPSSRGKRIEETYNTLKTYIMLHTRERIDPNHLTDQMPRHWRNWLEAHRGDYPMAEIARMAERTVAFYVSQSKCQDLPLIDNRDDLITQVRNHLRGDVAHFSPLERLYSEMKAQANTRYAPITVARILNNKDMDLIGSSAAVPGSFSREAWDGFFREALTLGSQGKFKGTDWVLASPLPDNLDELGSVEARHQKLLAMYQEDYIKEWEKFLQGVVIHPMGTLERASTSLARFGDPQSSPIKLILMRVATETAWDNPSELNKGGSKAGDSVIARTESLLGVGSSPGSQESKLGRVGGRFAPIAELSTSQAGGRSAVDGYLEILNKIRGKLTGITSSGDIGSGSRALMQATLSGSGSELAEGLNYVDSSMLTRLDETSKDVVRPLLLRPLMESFAVLTGPAQQEINTLWQQRVYGPWSSLATKYPFADSSNDATMAEIAKFLNQNDGTLPKFVENELGNLVARRGDTFVARTWGGQGIGLSPTFLNAISRLTNAASVLHENEASRLEFQPFPTPGLTDILLEIDGQKILYRMGPQIWAPIAWPSLSTSQGARLQVTAFGGATVQIHSFSGRLGLLRLLDNARVDQAGGACSTLEWSMKIPAGSATRASTAAAKGSASPNRIRFNLRIVSGANPLALKALRNHSLPHRICN